VSGGKAGEAARLRIRCPVAPSFASTHTPHSPPRLGQEKSFSCENGGLIAAGLWVVDCGFDALKLLQAL
jgi:hypothetical protein